MHANILHQRDRQESDLPTVPRPEVSPILNTTLTPEQTNEALLRIRADIAGALDKLDEVITQRTGGTPPLRETQRDMWNYDAGYEDGVQAGLQRAEEDDDDPTYTGREIPPIEGLHDSGDDL